MQEKSTGDVDKVLVGNSSLSENNDLDQPLALVRRLVKGFIENGVLFCHWKSNAFLTDSIHGKNDLDILVSDVGANRARTILGELGFIKASSTIGDYGWVPDHYYGLDDSGILVQVDLYDRLVTCGGIVKNHQLPIENLLFENIQIAQNIMPIPSKAAELFLLAIRRIVESSSVIEHAVMLREYDRITVELKWLLSPEVIAEAAQLFEKWQPSLGKMFFIESIDALKNRNAIAKRIFLGWQLAWVLRRYQILPNLPVEWRRIVKFAALTIHHIRHERTLSISKPGKIIAIVGPEASGKSTVSGYLTTWLGKHFATLQIHSGKPPSTIVSFLPNLILPFLRKVFSRYRPSNAIPDEEINDVSRPGLIVLLYSLRCLLVSFDCLAQMQHMQRKREKGVIIISDRYPTSQPGSVDGTKLDADELFASGHRISALLARRERRNYEKIPQPDLVIRLEVPLEVTLQRNLTRDKAGGPEPEMYIKERYSRRNEQMFGNAFLYTVQSTEPLEKTLQKVKMVVWKSLTKQSL